MIGGGDGEHSAIIVTDLKMAATHFIQHALAASDPNEIVGVWGKCHVHWTRPPASRESLSYPKLGKVTRHLPQCDGFYTIKHQFPHIHQLPPHQTPTLQQDDPVEPWIRTVHHFYRIRCLDVHLYFFVQRASPGSEDCT